ncbi:hypothetical protein [Alteraurantiacibacter aquimixticola]|uniref:AcrB/AcrD/AcrF family protein n=1 Tax=Alteraurantiacibacter aquimixticola TaxID=2489173 RepID=A0A4T3EWS5_9SPHN|nr:hypothetical protein [Alteraurantiacibacter aquimixticola]TIX49015.1 hypothetical protein E5222_14900 [Alteraurantiacibacter aquimixticola]
MPGSASFDWRAFAFRPAAVWAAWGLWCVVVLVLLPLRGFEPQGPDDYMRLFEVRDLLAGQGWYDVTQYRVNPPEGASMHWSRLVDIPLALVALFAGERAALIVVPLLYLLAALFALRAILRKLGFGALATGIGLLIMPMMPLLAEQFMPMRIDHHAPQAVVGLVAVALLVDGGRVKAALAGVLGAAWVAISLEGLPIIAAIAGVLGLAYWWHDDRRLGAFLGALAMAAPAFSLATRPVSDFALPYCDILMPGHMAAFAAAAVTALALPFAPAQQSRNGRLAGLAMIPLVCGPLAFVMLGECAADPFARLDPLLEQYWHGYITEGLPIWRQPLSVAAVLAWTLALVLVGWHRLRLGKSEAEVRPLDTLGLIAVLACLYSFMLMREGVFAQWLAIPFAASLLAEYLPKARALTSPLPRIAATLACFGLATPMFVSALLKPLDPVFASDTMRAGMDAPIDLRGCDLSQLALLEKGLVLAPLDIGPAILGQTPHNIVMASYHRNAEEMHDVLAFYTGSMEQGRALADKMQPDYVVACASKADLALYRTAAPDNMANLLVSGEVPDWLEPVEGFAEGPLSVYRVR